MSKKVLIPFLVLIMFLGFYLYSQSAQKIQEKQVKDIKLIKKPVLKLAYRFEIQGIKRIFTSPTKVICQVQYYIAPTYPKPCFIGAYVPDKANWAPGFSYKPAGRLPNGVPKGQKHFTDNIFFEVHYSGSS